MTKTHLIKDEELGGVIREYIEVDRKADEGDYVYITLFDDNVVSEIRKVDALSSIARDFYLDVDIDGEYYFDGDYDEYKTLEPTDIVQIDGERFRMVERKAEEGEKVLIVNLLDMNGDGYSVGNVFEVTNDLEPDYSNLVNVNKNITLYNNEYRVLEPVKSHPSRTLTVDITANDEFMELFANIVRRVSSLEQQLKDTQGNVERQAEELANYQDKIEMCIDDIVTLDARTQQKSVEAVTYTDFIESVANKVAEKLLGGDVR